jgi:hypothetical protein
VLCAGYGFAKSQQYLRDETGFTTKAMSTSSTAWYTGNVVSASTPGSGSITPGMHIAALRAFSR